MRGLALEAGQEGIFDEVLRLLANLLDELSLTLFLALAEGVLEELLSAALLHSLFLKNVLEQVFVALYEPLGVDLSVLDLFFAVALDALQQRLQTLLVLLAKLLHLAQQSLSEVLVHDV